MVRKAPVSARVVSAKRKPKKAKKWIKSLFVFGFVAITAMVVPASIYFSERLSKAAGMVPKLADIMESERMGPTQILSSDGKVLYESMLERREPITLDQVPEKVQKAILAAEDKRFYTHSGVDFWAIGRQVVENTREQRIAGGASTLTMQVAKMTFTSSVQTFERKIDDMALALQIERQLTKDQILELYMNQAYFGSGAYGLGAAAEIYFGKKVGDLTVAEAAMLARCVRRPSDQNPFVNYEISNTNKNVVLGIMREEGWLTGEEFEKAKAAKPKLAARRESEKTIRRAPYFVRYVIDQLRSNPATKDIEFEKGGYRIETTLHSGIQDTSDSEARQLVRQFRRSGVRTAAFVLMDKQGRILAMTGGIDPIKRQFNAVTQGRRQPGSSFKPFVYTAAFQNGDLSGPSDSISNATYTKRTGDGKMWRVAGNGATSSVQTAVAFSYNAAAVRAIEAVGPATAVRYANRVFGFDLQPRDAVMSLVLGSVGVSPLEMAEAYSVFQNFGARRLEPVAITRVIGPNNQVVYSFSDGANIVELRDTSIPAFQDIDSCMRAVVTQGTGRTAGGIRNARGKTGTTNDNRDAWFAGYTNDYIGVGWISGETVGENGRVTYQEMRESVMGGTVTVRMWRDVVGAAQKLLGESRRSGLGVEGSEREPVWRDQVDEPRVANDASQPAPDPNDTSDRREGSPTDLPEDPSARPERRPEPEAESPRPADPPAAEPPSGGNDLPDGSGLPPGPSEPGFTPPEP